MDSPQDQLIIESVRYKKKPLEEKFWRDVKKGGENECWQWVGAVSPNGYARLRRVLGRRHIRAHRYSYALHKGPIPDGMLVRHTCDNKLCVNPAHLLIGTAADNANDRVLRKRSKPTTGGAHPYSKLNEVAVIEIRSMTKSGRSMSSLAKRYGVGLSAISNVIAGITWKHVPLTQTEEYLDNLERDLLRQISAIRQECERQIEPISQRLTDIMGDRSEAQVHARPS